MRELWDCRAADASRRSSIEESKSVKGYEKRSMITFDYYYVDGVQSFREDETENMEPRSLKHGNAIKSLDIRLIGQGYDRKLSARTHHSLSVHVLDKTGNA